MSPRLNRLVALVCLLATAGCTEGRSPITPARFDAATPDAGPDLDPKAAAARRHPTASDNVVVPVPGEEVRPEGEPKGPEDLAALSKAAETGAPVQKPGAPPIKRLDAYRLRVGAVFVDRLNRFIEMPTKVNMQEGILEYVAVGTDGKLHESVLEVLAEPSHIHLALLLIGLEPRQYAKQDDMYLPPKLAREGGRIDLMMQWTDPASGEVKRAPPSAWLYDRKTKGAPPPRAWFFEGSQFWRGRYSADMERSVVALIPDMNAVIAIGSDAGNPYRGDAQGYEIYKEVIPPNGTPVKLIAKVHGVAPAKVEPGEKPAPAPLPPQPSGTPAADGASPPVPPAAPSPVQP